MSKLQQGVNSCLKIMYAIPSRIILHHDLIWQLTKREVIGRYRGSMVGIFWSFFTPLIMLSIYTFVFSVIFEARWQIGTGNKVDFALILFAGLIPYQLFADCINKAPSLILNNVNYVKKIVFPLEILAFVQLGSAIFHMLISVSVLIIAWSLIHQELHWTLIFFPLVNLPLLFFTLGLMWFFISLGVFFRDLQHTVGLISMVFLFLSPVFYAASIIPEPYQRLINLNPLTFILEQNREILLWGHCPDWGQLLINLFIAILFAGLGFYWFLKTSKGFADVL